MLFLEAPAVHVADHCLMTGNVKRALMGKPDSTSIKYLVVAALELEQRAWVLACKSLSPARKELEPAPVGTTIDQASLSTGFVTLIREGQTSFLSGISRHWFRALF